MQYVSVSNILLVGSTLLTPPCAGKQKLSRKDTPEDRHVNVLLEKNNDPGRACERKIPRRPLV